MQRKSSKKGIGLIGFMLIAELVAIVSVIIFITFFKYHIIVFANEINNFDKFQNFPNIFLTLNYADSNLNASIVFAVNNIENRFMTSENFRNSKLLDNLGKTLDITCFGILTDDNSFDTAYSGGNCDLQTPTYLSYISIPFPIFKNSPTVINMNFVRYPSGG